MDNVELEIEKLKSDIKFLRIGILFILIVLCIIVILEYGKYFIVGCNSC